ncbi:hypothetical protein AGMMS49975_29250 [Clostridia bacterium]|nr:hypothetical protein AGMMS49975_29250 [Clostridia bacterium]
MSDTRSSGLHIRINPEIKENVQPILDAIGLSFSDVFNLTLHQIYLKRKIPFELSDSDYQIVSPLPNIEYSRPFDNFDELWEELEI